MVVDIQLVCNAVGKRGLVYAFVLERESYDSVTQIDTVQFLNQPYTRSTKKHIYNFGKGRGMCHLCLKEKKIVDRLHVENVMPQTNQSW